MNFEKWNWEWWTYVFFEWTEFIGAEEAHVIFFFVRFGWAEEQGEDGGFGGARERFRFRVFIVMLTELLIMSRMKSNENEFEILKLTYFEKCTYF